MSHRTGCVLTLAAAAAFCAPWRTANAQRLAPGPQVLTFFSDVDDSEQPYGLYLPKSYDEKKEYPLVIMLHGAQSNHRLSLKRVFGFSNQQGETDLEATRYFQQWPDVDYIVASPLARGTMGYKGIPEKDVWDVVADVKRRFNIDEDRTYLTGLSMGGGGTLWIGLTRPDLWAAIAPVCPAPPFGTVERAPNALNFPVHFFQGGSDPVVNPEGTRGRGTAPAGAGRGGGAPGGAGFARQDISLGIDFFAPAQRSLTKWGDFILYNGTPTNILVQGRFDGNWKLTATDAEKLAATGVVTVSPVAR